jgi:hypothetical protein
VRGKVDHPVCARKRPCGFWTPENIIGVDADRVLEGPEPSHIVHCSGQVRERPTQSRSTSQHAGDPP